MYTTRAIRALIEFTISKLRLGEIVLKSHSNIVYDITNTKKNPNIQYMIVERRFSLLLFHLIIKKTNTASDIIFSSKINNTSIEDFILC